MTFLPVPFLPSKKSQPGPRAVSASVLGGALAEADEENPASHSYVAGRGGTSWSPERSRGPPCIEKHRSDTGAASLCGIRAPGAGVTHLASEAVRPLYDAGFLHLGGKCPPLYPSVWPLVVSGMSKDACEHSTIMGQLPIGVQLLTPLSSEWATHACSSGIWVQCVRRA